MIESSSFCLCLRALNSEYLCGGIKGRGAERQRDVRVEVEGRRRGKGPPHDLRIQRHGLQNVPTTVLTLISSSPNPVVARPRSPQGSSWIVEGGDLAGGAEVGLRSKGKPCGLYLYKPRERPEPRASSYDGHGRKWTVQCHDDLETWLLMQDLKKWNAFSEEVSTVEYYSLSPISLRIDIPLGHVVPRFFPFPTKI